MNELLDQGAVGLEWFRLALVRYHRVGEVVKLPGFDRIVVPAVPVDGGTIPVEPIDTTADPNKTMIALEGRYYDQQRSMNLDSLRKLSSEITGAALGAGDRAGAVDITGDLAGVAGAVPEAWQGQGGTAAQDHLAGFHAHATSSPSICSRWRRRCSGCRMCCCRSLGTKRVSWPGSTVRSARWRGTRCGSATATTR